MQSSFIFLGLISFFFVTNTAPISPTLTTNVVTSTLSYTTQSTATASGIYLRLSHITFSHCFSRANHSFKLPSGWYCNRLMCTFPDSVREEQATKKTDDVFED
jgi:hypothetical protein